MNRISISPPARLRGRIVLPASKSIGNRALLINALSGAGMLPANLSDCDDSRVMLRALQTMPDTVDIGAAGTAMRFLTAYLCVTPGRHDITGTERMCHRPIGILVDALRSLGADIQYLGQEGYPPLRITGRTGLVGGELAMPGDVSSQYVSALLMVAPTLRDGLRLRLTGHVASRPYLDMTTAMMRDFGARVEWLEDDLIRVEPVPYTARPYAVEGDWSAASYWYEMVALTDDMGAEIDLVGLRPDSIQGDSRVADLFAALGVQTRFLAEADGTTVARLTKTGRAATVFRCDFTHQPDLAQTFAVTCAMLGVPFRLTGLQSLRIKETDRMAALNQELGKLVRLEVADSEMAWDGQYAVEDVTRVPDHSLRFDTYEDHRMALALAPVCLRTHGWIQINAPQVVSKSYPGFWTDLGQTGFHTSCN